MRIWHTLAFVELHGAIVVVLVLEVPVGPGAESNGYGRSRRQAWKLELALWPRVRRPADRVASVIAPGPCSFVVYILVIVSHTDSTVEAIEYIAMVARVSGLCRVFSTS